MLRSFSTHTCEVAANWTPDPTAMSESVRSRDVSYMFVLVCAFRKIKSSGSRGDALAIVDHGRLYRSLNLG